MRKRTTHKNLIAPPEPISMGLEEEPLSVKRRRYAWIFGISVTLIGLVALGLWRSQGPAPTPETLSEGENAPDALIQKFKLVSTVQGKKTWEFYANVARLYQNKKEAYTDTITAYYYSKEKLVSTLTADKAVVNTETNATEADGHVELIVQNGSKLETEQLNWDPDTDLIHTTGHVHVFKGQDDISADGMVADTQLNNVKFTKNVHTQLRDTKEIQNFSKPKPF
jgi:LPS export ABC transporter protein LptC